MNIFQNKFFCCILAIMIGCSFGFASIFVCNENVCEIRNKNRFGIIIKRQPLNIDEIISFIAIEDYLYAVTKNGDKIKLISQGCKNTGYHVDRLNGALNKYSKTKVKNIDMHIH